MECGHETSIITMDCGFVNTFQARLLKLMVRHHILLWDRSANSFFPRIMTGVIIISLSHLALQLSLESVGTVVEFVHHVPHDQQEFVNAVVDHTVSGTILVATKKTATGVSSEEVTPG